MGEVLARETLHRPPDRPPMWRVAPAVVPTPACPCTTLSVEVLLLPDILPQDDKRITTFSLAAPNSGCSFCRSFTSVSPRADSPYGG